MSLYTILELKDEKDDLVTEIQSLRRLRRDSSIRRENEELRSEIEVLQEERHQLKAIIREMEDDKIVNNSQDGGSEVTDDNTISLKQKLRDDINCNIQYDTHIEFV